MDVSGSKIIFFRANYLGAPGSGGKGKRKGGPGAGEGVGCCVPQRSSAVCSLQLIVGESPGLFCVMSRVARVP